MPVVAYAVRLLALTCALVACGATPRPHPQADLRASSPPPSAAFGFHAPVVLQNASFRWGWVAACFARRDTDRNGVLEVIRDLHGTTSGDELEAYLLLNGRAPELVDEFVSASQDGRFVAIRSGGRLVVVDAETDRRFALPDDGRDLGQAESPALAGPAVRFSLDGRASMVRRSVAGADVMVIDLFTGQADVVFHTTEAVTRLDLLAEKVTVRLLAPGVVDSSVATDLKSGKCRGQPDAFFVARVGPDPTKLIEVPIARSLNPPTERERVLAGQGECTVDGARVIASSDGQHLLAAQPSIHGKWGPLYWTRAPATRRFCP